MPSFFGPDFDAMVRRLLEKLGIPRSCIQIQTAPNLRGCWGTCRLSESAERAIITLARSSEASMSREVYRTLITDTLLHELAHAIVMLEGKSTSHHSGWGAAYSRVYGAWEEMLDAGEATF